MLEQSTAVSATYIDRAADLAARVGGDGEALVRALRAGELGRFRTRKIDELERWLANEGYTDDQERLIGEDRRRLTLQRVAPGTDAGAADVNRVVSWMGGRRRGRRRRRRRRQQSGGTLRRGFRDRTGAGLSALSPRAVSAAGRFQVSSLTHLGDRLSTAPDEFTDREADIPGNATKEDGRHIATAVNGNRGRSTVRVAKLLV